MLFLFVPVLFFFGCSSSTNESSAGFPLIATHEPTVPFSTSEPERYAANIVIKSGGAERKIRVARDGTRRRIDYDIDQPQRRSVIQAEGTYLIDHERKIVAALTSSDRYAGDDEFVLHALNQRHNAEFEDAGTADGLRVFRAEIDGSPASEIVIFIDPATNLPMKQEYYSIEGERRDLTYTVELQDVTVAVDPELFEIPKGFREVAAAELRRRQK